MINLEDIYVIYNSKVQFVERLEHWCRDFIICRFRTVSVLDSDLDIGQ